MEVVIPCPGGLFDRKMGVLENGVVCTTDDLDKQDCPGFFGHIELAMPVFYVQFVSWIKGVLESLCFRCGALRVNKVLRAKEMNVIRNTKKNSARLHCADTSHKGRQKQLSVLLCMQCPAA